MSALVVLAHGSHQNPDSGWPCRVHAGAIERLGCFAQVRVGFWKEEPQLHRVLEGITEDDVYVVPFFMAEGYFTSKVLPRELGPWVRTPDSQRLIMCEPVGTDRRIVQVVLERAAAVCPEGSADRTLALIGHGTPRMKRSRASVEACAEQLRKLDAFAAVETFYTDDAPQVSKALDLSGPLVVVPMMTAPGYHTAQTIPEDLQYDPQNPGRLRIAEPVGTSPEMVNIILDRVQQASAGQWRAVGLELPRPFPGVASFMAGLDEEGTGLGPLWVWRSLRGVMIGPRREQGPAPGVSTALPEVLGRLRKRDDGSHRVLSLGLDMPTGWRLGPLGDALAARALEAMVPGAITAQALWASQGLRATVPWDVYAHRQSGVLKPLVRADARAMAAGDARACSRCAAIPVWSGQGAQVVLASDQVPCLQPCAVLAAAVVDAVDDGVEEG